MFLSPKNQSSQNKQVFLGMIFSIMNHKDDSYFALREGITVAQTKDAESILSSANAEHADNLFVLYQDSKTKKLMIVKKAEDHINHIEVTEKNIPMIAKILEDQGIEHCIVPSKSDAKGRLNFLDFLENENTKLGTEVHNELSNIRYMTNILELLKSAEEPSIKKIVSQYEKKLLSFQQKELAELLKERGVLLGQMQLENKLQSLKYPLLCDQLYQCNFTLQKKIDEANKIVSKLFQSLPNPQSVLYAMNALVSKMKFGGEAGYNTTINSYKTENMEQWIDQSEDNRNNFYIRYSIKQKEYCVSYYDSSSKQILHTPIDDFIKNPPSHFDANKVFFMKKLITEAKTISVSFKELFSEQFTFSVIQEAEKIQNRYESSGSGLGFFENETHVSESPSNQGKKNENDTERVQLFKTFLDKQIADCQTAHAIFKGMSEATIKQKLPSRKAVEEEIKKHRQNIYLRISYSEGQYQLVCSYDKDAYDKKPPQAGEASINHAPILNGSGKQLKDILNNPNCYWLSSSDNEKPIAECLSTQSSQSIQRRPLPSIPSKLEGLPLEIFFDFDGTVNNKDGQATLNGLTAIKKHIRSINKDDSLNLVGIFSILQIEAASSGRTLADVIDTKLQALGWKQEDISALHVNQENVEMLRALLSAGHHVSFVSMSYAVIIKSRLEQAGMTVDELEKIKIYDTTMLENEYESEKSQCITEVMKNSQCNTALFFDDSGKNVDEVSEINESAISNQTQQPVFVHAKKRDLDKKENLCQIVNDTLQQLNDQRKILESRIPR